jgi:hypothetical protein
MAMANGKIAMGLALVFLLAGIGTVGPASAPAAADRGTGSSKVNRLFLEQSK